MRIFVVGMPGAGNLGDDLISVLLVQHILKRWPKAEIGLLCAGYPIPFSYRCTDQIRFFPTPRRRSWGEYIERIQAIDDFVRHADLILIGGGGLFQDTHYRFTVHRWMRIALRASFQRIPTAAVGVGFGPFNYSFSRWYLAKTMARLSIIQVRDKGSAEMVESLGYPALIGPDIVSGTPMAQTTPFSMKHDVVRSPALGCSIRPWPGLSFETLVDTIGRIANESNLPCYLFVFEHAEPHNISEYVYALKIAEALEERDIDVKIFCYGRVSIEEFARMFGSVSMAIATRFHANILWQRLATPTLPLAYAPKVTRLYEEQGGKVLPIEKIDEDLRVQDMFQSIELKETYFLPDDTALMSEAPYVPWKIYLLSYIVTVLETGYGLARSIAWRLKQKQLNVNVKAVVEKMDYR